MILWAKAEALGTPNDQRVEAISIESDRTVRVRLCGRPEEEKILQHSDFCGVELNAGPHDSMAIMFKTTGVKRWHTTLPKTRKRKIQ